MVAGAIKKTCFQKMFCCTMESWFLEPFPMSGLLITLMDVESLGFASHDYNFTLDFPNSQFLKTNFRFPWRFKKS